MCRECGGLNPPRVTVQLMNHRMVSVLKPAAILNFCSNSNTVHMHICRMTSKERGDTVWNEYVMQIIKLLNQKLF